MGQLIRIRGRVQGVGFRPTVARLARARSLRGFVRNDADGLLVGLAEDDPACDAFLAALRAERPPLARIDSIERTPHDVRAGAFVIEPSQGGAPHTEIAPDAATCAACREEVREPSQRRHGYPFTSCTQCGPRYSIVTAIPYDRAHTTMARFSLCDACWAEYEDEADRRYHAQPLACAACGPQARIVGPGGAPIEGDPVDAAARVVREGGILALKGLGGYQLVCDATDAAAVQRLREGKRRPHKAFALMVADLDAAGALVELHDGARALLVGPEAPIVLLDRRASGRAAGGVAAGVAPHQRRLGVMLPTSPLHQLLADRVGHAVVCTSGNLNEEPQVVDDDEALARLSPIADAFLVHDRAIAHRVDDSVVAWMDGAPRVLRRARGYAPASIPLPPGFEDAPPLLALGGDDKATFALVDGGRALLSPHLGDLTNPEALSSYERSLSLLEGLVRHRASAVIFDAHPGYRTHALGRALARERGVDAVEVHHHHAHLAACLADNGWPLEAGPVLGVALDGLGLGEGGALFGGELFVVDYHRAERVGGLAPVPLIGGDRAAREPWRSLYAHLRAAIGFDELTRTRADVPAVAQVAAKRTPLIERMIDTGTRAPLASSTGRLFDAVAAALGLFSERVDYEGQAAMALEALVSRDALADGAPYPFAFVETQGDGAPTGQARADEARRGGPLLDPAPMWRALLKDLARGVERPTIAARFHRGLADAFVRLARRVAERRGLRAVALSGGCFQNRILVELVATGLRDAGLRVLTHRGVPPNDACLALGQAAVASARRRRAEPERPPSAP